MGKIRGLFVSVEQIIKHGLKFGEIMADKETIQKRIDICRACEFLEGNTCRHCGCFVALKGGLAATKCIIDKW